MTVGLFEVVKTESQITRIRSGLNMVCQLIKPIDTQTLEPVLVNVDHSTASYRECTLNQDHLDLMFLTKEIRDLERFVFGVYNDTSLPVYVYLTSKNYKRSKLRLGSNEFVSDENPVMNSYIEDLEWQIKVSHKEI